MVFIKKLPGTKFMFSCFKDQEKIMHEKNMKEVLHFKNNKVLSILYLKSLSLSLSHNSISVSYSVSVSGKHVV